MSSVLPVDIAVGGWPSEKGVDTSLPPCREGVIPLVTYDELFQFCLVILGVISLVIQITKKK